MIAVERATEADAAAAAAHLDGIYRRAPGTAARLARALAKDDFILLLAAVNETPAGYLHAQVLDRLDGERMLLIYDLEVAPQFRRRGVATELMDEVRRIAAAAGVARSWLLTEDDNEAACRLYESLDGEPFPAVGYEWTEK